MLAGSPDPFSIATGLAGIGLEIYGGLQTSKLAHQEAGIEKSMVGVEEQQDEVRRHAMALSASRQQMEQVRNGQRLRAMALNTASDQGAQFGSGVGGAYGSISGQIGSNRVGISQNLQFGENMFDLNKMLDQFKVQKADIQSQMSDAQGISSLGNSLVGASKFL